MGHWFAEIALSNPRKAELKTLRVNALADTGALMLCIPEQLPRNSICKPNPNVKLP